MPPSASGSYVYDRAPIMLYWEITRACDLACMHCRAEAMPFRHAHELSTERAVAVLRQILDFGSPLPHLVITGGDPLKRPDLFEIVAEAAHLGIRVSLAPSVTDLLTEDAIVRLRQAGMVGMSLSLDGSTPDLHDRIRGIRGCFDRTLEVIRTVRRHGIPLQINTLVTADTLPDLPLLFRLVETLDISRWSLFFLIAVGRGRVLRGITPADAERLCRWVCERAEELSFTIAPTEAPFFRRVAVDRMRRAGMTDEAITRSPTGRAFGVRDGNGILFVSHIGGVYPSGFLPVRAGDVDTASVVELYRHAPVFMALRDMARLKGKCARCPFKTICGGSRARAFAGTGDYLESDPLCAYQPEP